MSSPGPMILLIEDEPQMRRFLRVALEGSGYRYMEASTGQEGLDLAVQHRPEAILLDLGLPDMDGLDLMTRLRAEALCFIGTPLPRAVGTAALARRRLRRAKAR